MWQGWKEKARWQGWHERRTTEVETTNGLIHEKKAWWQTTCASRLFQAGHTCIGGWLWWQATSQSPHSLCGRNFSKCAAWALVAVLHTQQPSSFQKTRFESRSSNLSDRSWRSASASPQQQDVRCWSQCLQVLSFCPGQNDNKHSQEDFIDQVCIIRVGKLTH